MGANVFPILVFTEKPRQGVREPMRRLGPERKHVCSVSLVRLLILQNRFRLALATGRVPLSPSPMVNIRSNHDIIGAAELDQYTPARGYVIPWSPQSPPPDLMASSCSGISAEVDTRLFASTLADIAESRWPFQ